MKKPAVLGEFLESLMEDDDSITFDDSMFICSDLCHRIIPGTPLIPPSPIQLKANVVIVKCFVDDKVRE